ncbi:MAG TPA: EthD domain-containing protein [Solirubrobacteraceae bacterium]|nr:EthD domain-containing protein [Solirubrobacteraceae bacterium]
MQHRIFLAPAKPAVSWAEAQAHWRTHHARVMIELPGLLGYVQNCPAEEWWTQLPYLACAETWFGSRESEAEGYASSWYREQIAVDEERMFGRDDAWSSPVIDVQTVREGDTGRYRTLAFGAAPERLDGVIFDGRAEALRLLRHPPVFGERTVVSVWTEHAPLARRLAVLLGGLAFVSEPAAPLPPDEPPWRP